MPSNLHSPSPLDSTSPSSILIFPNQQEIRNHEPLARICASFIQQLFQRGPDPTSFFNPETYLPLPFVIAYALSKSPLDPSTVFGALSLLYRYRSRNPHRRIKLRDPSRLFIAAYVVAAKFLSDKEYPMRTWASLAQNNYDIHELAEMEREFYEALDWDVGFNAEVLDELEIIVDVFLSIMSDTESHSVRRSLPSGVPSASVISELSWESPRERASLPGSSRMLDDDWICIQENEQSRTSIEDTGGVAVEPKNRYKSLLNSISLHPNTPKPTKPSITKRFSNLFFRLGTEAR